MRQLLETSEAFVWKKNMKMNRTYAGELCQIIDNSENESTYSEFENYPYELNNTYETMIGFEALRQMCTRICIMKIKD